MTTVRAINLLTGEATELSVPSYGRFSIAKETLAPIWGVCWDSIKVEEV